MLESSARKLRPEDLLELKYVHDARLSADGCRAAYVTSRTTLEPIREVFEITIADLTTGMDRSLDFRGQAMYPRWSPDGTRLAFIGNSDKTQRLYVADADGQGAHALTPEGSEIQGAPSWAPDNSTVAFTTIAQQGRDGLRRITKRLFRADGIGAIDGLTSSIQLADARYGLTRALDTGVSVAMAPSFSPCGRRLLFLGSDAAAGYPPLDLGIFVLDLTEGKCRRLLDKRWYVAAAAWSPCGERIVFAGDCDSALTIPVARLWVVDRDGSNPRCRTEDLVGNLGVQVHHDMPTWGTSQSHLFAVSDALHAYATVTNGGCGEIWRIALDGPVRCEPVVCGERTCVIMDASSRTGRLLYGATDLHTPWDLHLRDLKSGTDQPLIRLNESTLPRWPRLHVEHLRFKSSDGLPLEGWHLRRADLGGPQPTVLFIHGGPELTVGHAFRFDFHLLAANGYAVLFSNFRGSSGYGEAFRMALKGDWGTKGFPDHMAAVDAAVQNGLADPERLGVWGPSHGGFATCWIVGHTDRFRAAVAESSVTNLATFYYLSDVPDIFIQEFGGRPDEIPAVYRERSPLTYAMQCRTPTLMLHGEADLRCPLAEAEQFYRALHDVGCPTELVVVPGMTHMGDSIGPLPARLAQNEALLEWFERHL